MSDIPSSSACIVGGLEPPQEADVIRAAARRIGLSAVAEWDGTVDGLPPGGPVLEMMCILGRAPYSASGELTARVHGPPETTVAMCSAISAETGGFVLSDTFGAWYAGHPVAFDRHSGAPSLSELIDRLSGAPRPGLLHDLQDGARWALFGTPAMPVAPGPFTCAVFPLVDADAFAAVWARESATGRAGWAWATLLASPLEVPCEFVILRRSGRADPEMVHRLVRSLRGVPAAAFELIDGRGTTWWLNPDHPPVTEPLTGVVELIDLLGGAALLMGSSAAALAWPM